MTHRRRPQASPRKQVTEAVPPPPVAPRDWKAEAASLEHMLTHKPYNIYCDICRRSKPQRKAKPDRAKQRARAVDGDPIAGRDKLAFGDRCTGDYFLQRRSEYKGSKEKNPDESAQFPGATCAVVFFDLGTDWRETLPRCTRSSEETRKAVQHFEGPDEKVKQMYCDGAPELKRAMADVGIINPTSTPGCPATNGIAEACVKDSKNGTRCAHIQAGFEASWWERAATCYSFHTNITPRSRWAGDAKASAYERRHLEKCKAQLIPHGALVDFMPVPFPQNTPAPFAARAIPGLMVDLEVHPGGVWSGDYWIVEYEPLRKEPELPLAVAMHRGLLHRTKEVWLVREGGSIRFPLGERRTMLARLPPGMHAAEGDPLYDVAGTADAVAPAEGLLTGAAPSTEPPQDDVSPSAGPSSGLPQTEGAPDTLAAFEGGRWGNFPRGGIGPIDWYKQRDERGEAGYTDLGTHTRQYAGSQKPPHIDEAIWRRMLNLQDRQEAIAEYLGKLREGGYVRPGAPETPVERSGISVPAVRRRGKINPYQTQSTSLVPTLDALPLHIVVLTDGADTVWREALTEYAVVNEFVRSFDLMSRTASDVIPALDAPSTLVIIQATCLKGPLSQCRPQVRTFLHEAGKILRHVFEALGGSSVLLAATDSPVMCAAKLAKITIDCRWEEVFRRYDPQDPWTRGRYYVMSNNAQVKRAMYGFMDPALTSQRAVGEVNDSLALPETDFVRMLAAMLMDGARVDHSEFKYGMYQLMRNPTAPTNHVRDKCRLAIVRALRPREASSSLTAAAGLQTSPACPSTLVSPTADLGSWTSGIYDMNPDRIHNRLIASDIQDVISTEHRDRIPDISRLVCPSLVARKVPRSELKTNPEVRAAMKAELAKQLNAPWPKCSRRNPTGKGKGTWDISTVCEKRTKIAELSRKNEIAHFGRVCSLCYEKGSELPKGDKERKMRARSVFLGDNVKDTWHQEAEMEGLGAAVPAMEDSRTIDAHGLKPGYNTWVSDADSAYLQAWLGSKCAVWAEIPEEYWLPEWYGKYEHPICLLVLALYGHEDSGGYWEEKSYGDVAKCGWEKVPGRRGVFMKTKENATLMIYVDDFKMACADADKDRLWAPLRQLIRLSEPQLADRYLGCYTHKFKAKLTEFAPLLGTLPAQWSRKTADGEKRAVVEPWKPADPHKVVDGLCYDMSQYLKVNVIDKYCSIAGIDSASLKFAPTPFLDESKDEKGMYEKDAPAAQRQSELSDTAPIPPAPTKSQRKQVARAAHRAAAAGKNKKPPLPGSGFTAAEGELCRNAACVCMAALYAGRLARFDLLRAIQRLAESFHKWTKRHSQKLHRLMEYINSHLKYMQYGFIGDPWEDLQIVEFVDADWASDNDDKKSTTGALLVLFGPNSFYPLGAICKKQGCQSLSTPEAEVVALTVSLKDLVFPMLDLFEHVLQRKKVVPIVFEDNEATQKIVKTGKVEKAMGHIGRTHEIQVPWTCDMLKAGHYKLVDCHTKAMAADVFTKAFVDPIAWCHALTLLSVFKSIKYVGNGPAACSLTAAVAAGAYGALVLPAVPPFPVGPAPAEEQAMGGAQRNRRSEKKVKFRSQAAAAIAVHRQDFLPAMCCGGSSLEDIYKQEPNTQHNRCGNKLLSLTVPLRNIFAPVAVQPLRAPLCAARPARNMQPEPEPPSKASKAPPFGGKAPQRSNSVVPVAKAPSLGGKAPPLVQWPGLATSKEPTPPPPKQRSWSTTMRSGPMFSELSVL